MIPGLGKKYDLEIETTVMSRDAYRAAAYQASGLPAAPAIMVGDELVVKGGAIEQEKVEAVIRRQLGMD